MSITLASVFDDRSEAMRARERLLEAGIDGTQVRIEDNEEELSELRKTRTEARPSRRGFFAELFGLGDDGAEDSAGHYAEAVRRGATVLAVTLPDESRVAEVSEILDDCGAVDIDRCVEQWRAGGYERHDESAPMYRDEEIRAERERRAGRHGAVLQVVEEDRPAGQADLLAFQEQTIELRETREEPVVDAPDTATASTSSRSALERRPTSSPSDVYSGPNRRVANDSSYRGPERRRSVAMP